MIRSMMRILYRSRELAVEAIEELRLAVDELQQVLVLLENGNGESVSAGEGKK